MIIGLGFAPVDNHILKGTFLLSPSQECNIYFIMPNFYAHPLLCMWYVFYYRPREIVKSIPSGRWGFCMGILSEV